ncbi:MAG: aspartate kinase [Prolixibacteraceae bacterium]|nr:aspartate kinase [Prolixibacteraceae bacterium]MBT6007409.1 aspartate kinase [Prolixibacteraceae bacterium]MBT6997546.1 aspartate kinase [Prolixibacteraceae bacterium]MBT7394560.1 aspartate kinase [Prolixibacteraceae bacterium]
MKVFKFGGASVKSAEAVRNVLQILKGYNENIVVVISAMGKTTNLLETLAKAYFEKSDNKWSVFQKFRNYHTDISDLLFDKNTPESISILLTELENKLRIPPSFDFNFEYDQIVSYGELVSTRLVSEYLNFAGFTNSWIDIRTCLRTNNKFRDATVDWDLTEKLVQQVLNFEEEKLYVTQGFIGATKPNLTTTLGREGSDFTAAILGNVLNAEDVSIWKDVPGVLNADPKKMEGAVKIDELSYREAIEMSYSGAQVIHPKTMKPLHNKGIPLLVKSFVSPLEKGTVIHEVDHKLQLQPVFIVKENQVLITISPIDFSFISIEDINKVAYLLQENRIKVNLIQQSAIDFNLVVDFPEVDLNPILKKLSENYIARYNTDLKLITIRHFNKEALHKMKKDKKIYLEQNSRLTARLVVK